MDFLGTCISLVTLCGCLIYGSFAVDSLSEFSHAYHIISLELAHSQPRSSHAGCRTAVRISTDRTILPLQDITALRPGSFSPLFRIVSSSDEEQWCANTANSGPAVGNYINLTFSESILVEAIVSRGHNVGEQPVFVSSFSILHSLGTNPLQQYNKV